MSQIKIFGLARHLSPRTRQMSDVIHSCVVDALKYSPYKRAHRFFPRAGDELPLDYKVEV